jgi:nitrate reductase assembly molybdenum cofactor insertion protein NarJ
MLTNRINELPNFLPLILRFLVVVVVLEFILRFLYEIKELVTGDTEG